MFVFVYGTLKKNKYNHRVISNSKYLGKATAKGYAIFVSRLPYMVKDENSICKGELYWVDPATLLSLDYFEGHPNFYRRETIEIEDENNDKVHASAYIYQDETVKYKYKKVVNF